MQNTVACDPCDHVNISLHVCSDVKADHSNDKTHLSECVAFSQQNTQTQFAYRELHAMLALVMVEQYARRSAVHSGSRIRTMVEKVLKHITHS